MFDDFLMETKLPEVFGGVRPQEAAADPTQPGAQTAQITVITGGVRETGPSSSPASIAHSQVLPETMAVTVLCSLGTLGTLGLINIT